MRELHVNGRLPAYNETVLVHLVANYSANDLAFSEVASAASCRQSVSGCLSDAPVYHVMAEPRP